MLVAEGTASAPIVMTSAQANPALSDWSGLHLLGRGIVNLAGGVGQVEGLPVFPSYGGNDPAHDCGTLAYFVSSTPGFRSVNMS